MAFFVPRPDLNGNEPASKKPLALFAPTKANTVKFIRWLLRDIKCCVSGYLRVSGVRLVGRSELCVKVVLCSWCVCV